MKAAVMTGVNAPFEIAEVAIAKPGPREVLIRTRATGVCHSDLHFYQGSYPTLLPTILGHESAGIVEAVGSEVRTVRPGDHVVTCLSAFCGHCEYCITGHLSLCFSPETQRGPDDEPRLHGNHGNVAQFLNLSAFAEQMLVHENACVAIDRDMPFDRAAVIGCAVITGYGAVAHTAGVRPGETVAVIGCGGVGLSAINAAAIAGAGKIIAIDRAPEKEALARQFGATHFVNAAAGSPVAAVLELTQGGAHHAIEAIGLSQTVQDAFSMLRRGGAATVVGMVPVGQKVSVDGWEFIWEKKLQGSQMGSNRFPVDILRLVDFYLAGKLNLDALVSRHISLAEITSAFDEMKTGAVARSVIMFS